VKSVKKRRLLMVGCQGLQRNPKSKFVGKEYDID
jgi:hypothetical protein